MINQVATSHLIIEIKFNPTDNIWVQGYLLFTHKTNTTSVANILRLWYSLMKDYLFVCKKHASTIYLICFWRYEYHWATWFRTSYLYHILFHSTFRKRGIRYLFNKMKNIELCISTLIDSGYLSAEWKI